MDTLYISHQGDNIQSPRNQLIKECEKRVAEIIHYDLRRLTKYVHCVYPVSYTR